MAHLMAFDPPTDGVLLREDRTSAYVNETSLGMGTLYITESSVDWLNELGRGFLLKYPDISLHAVSRDLTAFAHPCLYVMADSKLNDIGGAVTGGDGDNNAAVDGSDEDDDDDDEGHITEIRFVPANADSLDTMYQAMSDGNVLHPDADDSFSDDNDEEFDPTTTEGFIRSAIEETNGDGHLLPTESNADDADQVNEDQFANPDDDDDDQAMH